MTQSPYVLLLTERMQLGYSWWQPLVTTVPLPGLAMLYAIPPDMKTLLPLQPLITTTGGLLSPPQVQPLNYLPLGLALTLPSLVVVTVLSMAHPWHLLTLQGLQP